MATRQHGSGVEAEAGRPRRVSIDPLTRVEGHGKVTLLQDEAGRITEARLHIVEFRGFERFIQGRPYQELPVVVQRLCGICPVSHHLAAGKAIDHLFGVSALPPTAEQLRRALHLAQVLQSHAVHFFHLASPDLLLGFDRAPESRNIVGVIREHADIARKGIALRKFGQEVIEAITGKRVHGVAVIPGGMNKPLAPAARDRLAHQIDDIVTWAQEAVALMAGLYLDRRTAFSSFGAFPSPMMGLVDPQGRFELYDGALRVQAANGDIMVDQWPDTAFPELLVEEARPWSYMKFPYLRQLGPENGWYRVGPLARLNLCTSMGTPLAEAARHEWLHSAQGGPVTASLAYHWARLIELLHCAEGLRELLADPVLVGTELRAPLGPQGREAIGVIEAPRGTLFHQYLIDAEGLVEKANLVVSTTNNNEAMNRAIREVAATELDGQTLTEALLNRVEVAIRAYDPCLSCATHAIGQMPLVVELTDHGGARVSQIAKDAEGRIRHG